ncbi:MAG TPA: hypothetical protein V6D10_26220 [Trichocoleus sp.]
MKNIHGLRMKRSNQCATMNLFLNALALNVDESGEYQAVPTAGTDNDRKTWQLQ